ncbi:Hypothetical protein FKW44_021449, partial [Caligus rogercresseyi]
GSPSLLFVNGVLPLVFMNVALPLIFAIGVPSSKTSSILKTFSSFWNLLLDASVLHFHEISPMMS